MRGNGQVRKARWTNARKSQIYMNIVHDHTRKRTSRMETDSYQMARWLKLRREQKPNNPY